MANQVLHTCAFQKNSSRLHPRVKGYTGLADQLLLRAYTCVLQSISIQGCTQVSRVTMVWQISCCCENTHVTCVLQKKPTQGWFGRPHPEGRTHMRAAKYKSFEGCTQGQGLQLQGFGRPRNTHVCPRKNKLRVARKDLGIKKYEGLAPTSCCCEHTYVCCRISKLRLHPRIRGLQGLGRPGAAASTHMCVSEKTPFIQGCTQGSKGCMGSADELLL